MSEHNMLLEKILNETVPSHEENNELIRMAQDGDKMAREELVIRNGRLVIAVMSRYVGQYKNMKDDLIQEGMIGLNHSIDTFDLTRGTTFSTHAVFWIRQKMRRYISQNGRTIRIPDHLVQRIHKMHEEEQRYLKEGNSLPTDEQLAGILGITVEKVQFLHELDNPVTSLYTPIGDDEGTVFGDMLPDELDMEEEVEDNIFKENMAQLLKGCLDDRSYDIVCRRSGFLSGGDVYTLEEIANDYEITRERVRQIQKLAGQKVKQRMRHRVAVSV